LLGVKEGAGEGNGSWFDDHIRREVGPLIGGRCFEE